MLQLTVDEIMNAPVETVGTRETATSAATRLTERGIGSLVVCDGEEPVGIITDVDITRSVSRGFDPAESRVEEFMASPLVTVESGTSLVDAARILRDHTIKRLPVVDDGELVGIVTTTDLSNFIPHLARLKRGQVPPEDGPHVAIRADTAYERDGWEYEYHGDESDIDVGDTVRFGKELSNDDVEHFADISGDTNRLHLDAEYAVKTRFGERIAHGTLVSGIISAALARLPGLTIYLSQELSFLGPVGIGDRVTAECTVVEDFGSDRFRLTTDVVREDGETVIDGEAVILSDAVPDLAPDHE